MKLKLLAAFASIAPLYACASPDVPREKSAIPMDALTPAPQAPLLGPPVSKEESSPN
jgi:hypothetical protein